LTDAVERPPGCKTVFVGGLPENSTEALIVEVFGQLGEIIAIRKSKKNFCHIRFAEEFTVDRALFLSGTFPMFSIKLHAVWWNTCPPSSVRDLNYVGQ
uniref:RRM domain-containing protein n=1 Tax=Hucho hucho TaxID=62062 RepID=A0A4W5K8J9_9TELE